MESKQSNEKKINLILDGEQIRELIKQHKEHFAEKCSAYVNKTMNVDGNTGVSSIRINIGGKKTKVYYSDSMGFYTILTEKEFRSLKDCVYSLILSTYYDDEQFHGLSFSEDYNYKLILPKDKSQQKYSQYPYAKLIDTNSQKLLEKEIKELETKRDKLNDMYLKNQFWDLVQELNFNKSYIDKICAEMVQKEEFKQKKINKLKETREGCYELAYYCKDFDIGCQIERLKKQYDLQKVTNEHHKYATINTEPSKRLKIGTNQEYEKKKKKNLNININNIGNTKGTLNQTTVNLAEKIKSKKPEKKGEKLTKANIHPNNSIFAEISPKAVPYQGANDLNQIKINLQDTTNFSFNPNQMNNAQISNQGKNLGIKGSKITFGG